MKHSSPLKVVAFGGGNGLSALLQGLKHYARPSDASAPQLDITAIVTVTDDGGSSGRLRREFDVLPPGDAANALGLLDQAWAQWDAAAARWAIGRAEPIECVSAAA